MYRYCLFEDELFSPYIGQYHTYGIRVFSQQFGEYREIMCLSDVSTDFSFVQEIVEILTREQLEPIHLLDVLADLL